MTSKLQDSILILSTLSASIQEFLKVLEKEHANKSSVIYAAVSGQILLQTYSFKEEWKIFQSLGDGNEKIQKVREATKYFTKRINQWTDLEILRNTFLAHNFRDKSTDNRLIIPYGRKLKIPNRYPDYVLLCGCIHYIHIVLTREFSEEMNTLAVIIKDRTAPDIHPGISTLEEALNELESIIDKSDLSEYLQNRKL